jgi:hypothetical protein
MERRRACHCDALAVEKQLWMIDYSAFDILNWPDILLQQHVRPAPPYNHRDTDHPLDIEYRIEDRITDRFDDIGVSQTQLHETYADRHRSKYTINVYKQGGLGRVGARDRATAKTHVFLSLYPRLDVKIMNYERGGNSRSPNLAL